MKKLRVIVVEDHPITRKGLCDAIDAEPDMVVVGQADTRAHAACLVKELRPDLLLMDLSLKDGDGWDLVDRLRRENCLPPTLVLSVRAEVLYARRLLRAGARGYLMKEASLSEIIAGLRKVAQNKIAVSDIIADQLMQAALSSRETESGAGDGLESLSDRELQILSLLGREMRAKDIASMLMISDKSVATYKARILSKLGLSSSHELISFARQQHVGE